MEELLELTLEKEDEKENSTEMLCKQEAEFYTKVEPLANTIIQYDEYLYRIEKQSQKANDSWSSQLQLIHADMKRQLSLCGIQGIVFEQEKADPSFCDIIETVPTTESDKDNTISEVISPGYIYREKIKKKLKFTIYKYVEE